MATKVKPITLPKDKEENDKRLLVDSVVGDINFAMQKINMLIKILNIDYFDTEFCDDDCESFKYIKNDMFLINTMMADYLDDIELALDGIKTEIVIVGDLAENSEV